MCDWISEYFLYHGGRWATNNACVRVFNVIETFKQIILIIARTISPQNQFLLLLKKLIFLKIFKHWWNKFSISFTNKMYNIHVLNCPRELAIKIPKALDQSSGVKLFPSAGSMKRSKGKKIMVTNNWLSCDETSLNIIHIFKAWDCVILGLSEYTTKTDL